MAALKAKATRYTFPDPELRGHYVRVAPSGSKTFAAVGLTPLTFEGAAALYALVAGTPLGQTSPEDWRRRAGTPWTACSTSAVVTAGC